MATMDQAQFDRWLYVYQKAAIAVHHRKDKVARAAELIERDLLLLGATAIEDKLQHGVPETLRDLARVRIVSTSPTYSTHILAY
jgi:magnesium-transporting ATPase (P-type)